MPSTYTRDMSTNPDPIDTSSLLWRADTPYDHLPKLPPKVEIETRAVLKRCIEARTALAELKQAVHLIPNQNMLINTLPILEAQASSAIENIVTTADELFRALPDDRASDPATREALRYREALIQGFRSLGERPLGTRTAEAIASRIKGAEMTVRRHGGTVLRNSVTGDTVYTPPQGEGLLRDLLGNWERFLHREDSYDPLVRMAIGHYQFEAIHPFTDGNGRTGRVLNSLYLIEQGLLDAPVLYASRHIIAHKSAYYERLAAVTSTGEWEAWVLFMLEGITETATWTLAKVAAIRSLVHHTISHVQSAAAHMYQRELVDVIFEQPYCRIQDLVTRGIAKRQTASKYLHALVAIGVLQALPIGRQTLFVHPKLLRLLTSESNDVVPYS